MIKIALDVSGGDYAPLEILKGAYSAFKELENTQIILVGQKEKILSCVQDNKFKDFDLPIVDASEIIAMDEPAALSVRRKRNSSIVKGIELLKNKQADAFVSCGNTGAVVSAAVLGLRLIKGVERPGIGIVVPTKTGTAMMIDVGANIGTKPNHLLQYAVMADIYSKKVLKKENPKVGILNIGEEETKGTEFIKETRILFEKAYFNFIGNIEAKDVYKGVCDCIICDGFLGNVALKISEGLAETVGYFLLDYLRKDFLGKIGLFLAQNALRKFKRKIDYSEYGGAPLLGVDGIVIIGHGRSDARAVKSALKVAREEVERNINDEIRSKIESVYAKIG